jgi:hypothetical protein
MAQLSHSVDHLMNAFLYFLYGTGNKIAVHEICYNVRVEESMPVTGHGGPQIFETLTA